MPHKNPEDRRAYIKAWRAKNKDKRRAEHKAYYEKNKEKVLARTTAYNKVNKENKKAWAKAYREANIERERARCLAHYYNNKEKYFAQSAKRRAAKLNRTPGWLTEEDLKKIQEFYNVAQKKKEETGEEWHVDHIIPLQGKNISGLHVPNNLQILRAKENLSKHNRYTI